MTNCFWAGGGRVELREDDLRFLAHHEPGHAWATMLLPNTDPMEKIAIVPCGQSMGNPQQLQEEEKYIFKKEICY